MSQDLTLVPPTRFGALLTEQRTSSGITIDELRGGADLEFSSDELRDIEQGRVALNDDQLHALMSVYGAAPGSLVPERSELIVDLHHGALFAGKRTRMLPEDAGFDDILSRYLSLLYLMRDLEPGHQLALRSRDVATLSEALERSLTEIEGRLAELMMSAETARWVARLRRRFAVPAAGLLVGLTSVGSLVLVQFPKGARPTLEPVDGEAAAAGAGLGLVDAELGNGIAVTAAPSGVASGRVELDYEPGDPVSVGAAAEALIAYPLRTYLPGWEIDYQPPRSGYFGNTNTVTRTITVHVADHDTADTVAGVLAHEVAHALDVMYLDDDARQRWLTARELDAPWWPESGAPDFHVGAGDFAEAFAQLYAQSPSDSTHDAFTEAHLVLLAELVPEPVITGR